MVKIGTSNWQKLKFFLIWVEYKTYKKMKSPLRTNTYSFYVRCTSQDFLPFRFVRHFLYIPSISKSKEDSVNVPRLKNLNWKPYINVRVSLFSEISSRKRWRFVFLFYSFSDVLFCTKILRVTFDKIYLYYFNLRCINTYIRIMNIHIHMYFKLYFTFWVIKWFYILLPKQKVQLYETKDLYLKY